LSERRYAYLRTHRRAGEIVLGADGRALLRDPEPAGPPLPADDPAALARASELLEQAHARAGEIVAQALREASATEHDAYTEGRQAGYRDGALEARGELADAMALLQRALNESRTIHDRLLRNAEHELIELVIDVARSVLGAQLALEPALVLDTVERALARAGAQNVVRVRVHPGDRGTVTAAMTERHGEAVPFAILDDHTVSVGGCVIDTAAGEIDARLDVQLDEIARILRSSLPDAGLDGGGGAARGAEARS
jgi:flagellar assembly protein FliH